MADSRKKQKIISRIAKRVEENYSFEKIILFESYALGSPDETGGINIFIIRQTNDRPDYRQTEVRRSVAIREPISLSPVAFTTDRIKYLLETSN